MTDGTRVLLARHGDHDWLHPPINRMAGRLGGITLNALGRAQAASLGRRLRASPPRRIVASPLERTRETADIIAEFVDGGVVADDRLVETGMGRWEGMTVPDVMAQYPHEWRVWQTAPATLHVPWFEPVDAIADRMMAVVRDEVRAGGHVLFVSHRDPLLALACRLLDLPLDAMRRMDIAPGSLTVFEVTHGRMSLVALNSLRPETT